MNFSRPTQEAGADIPSHARPSARFTGKVAIVTGGTSGIGRGLVQQLCAEGAAVLFTGRNLQRGETVAAATGAVFAAVDAGDADHAARTVDAALAAFGSVDLLVNNAGAQERPQGLRDLSRELFDGAFSLHVRAPWELMGAVAPLMQRSGGGSIVNVASIAAHRVGSTSLPYAASKAALVHLTRCAAAELGSDNIRVNSVSPGYLVVSDRAQRTEKIGMANVAAGVEQALAITAKQSLKRLGRIDDAVEAVLFLLSDQAAFITGADLMVDGGMAWGQAERSGR